MPYVTRIDRRQIYPTSRLVSRITGLVVPANKPIVGANAFAHESGIHQDGVLKKRATYEIMTPRDIGLDQNLLVLGKHSGRHAFQERLKEMGYVLSPEDFQKVFDRFKDLADKKKEVVNEDLEALIADEILMIPDTYKLVYLNVISGNVAVPTATVQIEWNGEILQKAGFGVGPIDATFNTINKITRTRPSQTLELCGERHHRGHGCPGAGQRATGESRGSSSWVKAPIRISSRPAPRPI